MLGTAAGCSDDPPSTTDGSTGDVAGTDDVDSISTGDAGGDAGAGEDAAPKTDTKTTVDANAPNYCAEDKDCADKVGADAAKCEVARCKNNKCVTGDADEGATCGTPSECYAEMKCTKNGKCEGEISCKPDADEGDAECIESFCDSNDKCAFKNKTGDCDDGNSCTETDKCAFKQCLGNPISPKICDDNNACTKDSCDPKATTAKEQCKHDGATLEGDPCNDGSQCTLEGKCEKGVCKSGTKITCNDNEPCTKDTCDKDVGCEFKALSDGADCDDKSKCTENDTCDSGKCGGKLIPDAEPASACEQLSCDPKTGKVTAKGAQDGLKCDDGKPCTIGDQCLTGQCKGKPLLCNLGDPCKEDFCDEATGSCDQKPKTDGTKCDDGNACVTKTTCKGGSCSGIDWKDSAQCDDKNACTSDGCSPKSGCFHVPANDKFCDDGDACSELDKCFGGKCAGQPKSCDDNNPCTKDACDPKNGKCTNQTFIGPCDDGKKCTTNTICVDGKCAGDDVVCDDKNPCTADSCDSLVGCKYMAKAGGAPCDDGVSCTLNDKCDGGKCKGDDKCLNCATDTGCLQLNDGNPCTGTWKCKEVAKDKKVCEIDPATIIKCPGTADECSAYTCNSKTAKCDLGKKIEGTPCKSADQCLDPAKKTCSADGSCVGPKLDCDDKEACTNDACIKAKGCVHIPKADKTSCDDGNVCTPTTTCMAGKCDGANTCECPNGDSDCTKYEDGDLCNGIWGCVADATGKKFCKVKDKSEVNCDPLKGEPCLNNVCDKGTGKCGAVAVPNLGECDDENPCTIKESCKKGKCEPGGKIDCNDKNPCTVDVCGKVFGCGNAPVNDGGSCTDGNACTEKDKCLKGKCSGIKKTCDDDNQCTVDVCDTKKGGCSFILNDEAECDDGNPCTNKDTCKNGKCESQALKCDDKNSCTVDACDGAGGCKNVLVIGKDCDDGEHCTISDSCANDGKCLGKQKNCSDGNDCTSDACVKGACVITALIGKACSDDSKCTENDKCDPQGACVSQKVNCDDGNPCTAVIGECSPKNGCNVVQSDGKFCNDNNKCTTNTKCQGGSCQGVKLNCNDNNPCTDDSCVGDKGCVNKQNVCDDGNECTTATCSKSKGCVFAHVDGFQPCDDGDGCTTDKGVCNKTKCEAPVKKCDDKNDCTADKCDPKLKDKDGKEVGGCVFLPIQDTATNCDDGDACTWAHCDGDGECHPHSIKCDDKNPCTQDSCDQIKGCITSDMKEQSPCDDGDECTKKTVCQGGFCSGGVVSCPLCKNGTDEECAIFDDNNLCNGSFKCKLNDPLNPKLGGKCVEKKDKVICNSLDDTPCNKNRCNTLTGKCKKTQMVNGSPCDDGVPCTIKDVCNNGSCQSGVTADCSSVADECNEAICIKDLKAKEGYACVGLPKQGTVTCNADNNGCTAQDRCEKGSCKAGKPIDCDGLQGECETVACVNKGPKAFTCKISVAKNYSSCDDGQLCTAGDFCEAGKCKAGLKQFSCLGKKSECADFFCDAKGNGATGACMPKAKNEGGSCNADDNGCTVKDICVLGVCIPGAPANCSEKNGPCTIGACKPGVGAAFACVTAPRNEEKPCDADGNGCTIDDHCKVGKCVPGKVKDCSSLNGNGGCQVGACVKISASQGSCKGVPAPIGKACNADNNGCTKDDKCNKDGACMNGATVNCLAFAGTCATGKCEADPKDPNKFTCKGDSKPDGTKCDADGDGCTVLDKCAKGKCVAGPAPDCSKEAKGTCILGGCKNKGSDQYLCLPKPKTDGDVCDADKNGCTVKDSCIGGTCAKGALETCAKFAGLCAVAKCQSETPTKFTCQQTLKESYPDLDPIQSCDPSAKDDPKKPKCPANYTCFPLLKMPTKEGVCNAKVQIQCADGDACSENDVCSKGKCTAGKQKDCDDKDACTLDSCKDGKCLHKPLVGCTNCIDEDFEYQVDPKSEVKIPALPAVWAALNTQEEPDLDHVKPPLTTYRYASWQFQKEKTFNNSLWALRAKWEAKFEAQHAKENNLVISRLQHKRIYAKKGPLTLVFQLHMVVYNQKCTSDNFEVYINNTKVWERCTTINDIDLVDGFLPVTIDLSKYTGAPIDIDFRVIADATAAGHGLVTLDDIKLTGNCGPSCMANSFQNMEVAGTDEGQTKPSRIPGVWKVSASAPSYAAWKVDTKVGHTDAASIKAAWAKAPPGGKEQTATITIPQVMPVNGDMLHFAVRMTEVGSSVCGEDDLNVLIGGKIVYKRCSIQKDWAIQTIDLSSYAAKTIDIVFQAKTGKGSGAKGSIELDDIAVAGKCKYLCMYDDFDTEGMKRWNTSSTDVANMKWVLSNKKFHTKPNSAYAEHGKLAKDDKGAALLGKASAGMQVFVPIAGAEFEYYANIFIGAELCGEDPLNAAASAVGVSLQVPEEAIVITEEEPDPGDVIWNLASYCESTSGWAKKSGAVPVGAHGRKVIPSVELGKVKGNNSTKAYFDTFRLICK